VHPGLSLVEAGISQCPMSTTATVTAIVTIFLYRFIGA